MMKNERVDLYPDGIRGQVERESDAFLMGYKPVSFDFGGIDSLISGEVTGPRR